MHHNSCSVSYIRSKSGLSNYHVLGCEGTAAKRKNTALVTIKLSL